MKSKKITSDCLGKTILATLLLVLALPVYATMTMTPYLQAVTSNSIYVLVECNLATPLVNVQYGLTTAYGTTVTATSASATVSPVSYIHKIKLTGLAANTVYHYRAYQTAGMNTADYTFTTAALPGTSYRFAAMGDFRTNTSIFNAISLLVKNANPRFSIYGGDLCNDSNYSTFKTEFFCSNQLALIAKVPFFNAPGNHETWGTNTQATAQAPTSSSGTQEYYSFDYGDVHFVSINNQTTYSVGSTQYNWVNTDLSTSTKPWKIVIFHEPAYCAGGSHAPNTVMQSYSTNIFEPNNVSMVIAGHNHYYEHCLVNNLHHYVIGSAGAPLYSTGTASYLVYASSTYCYGIIDVTPKTMRMVVYNQAGTQIDSIDLANSVKGAKSLPNATALTITQFVIVTYVPAAEAGVFYVQDPTGVSGIRVETSSTRPVKGNKVKIKGTVNIKTNGERVISGATYPTPSGSVTIKPRALSNKAVGGSGYVGNPGGGASNQGLLVKVWGKVSKVSGTTFWLDDGSGVDNGEVDGTHGLKVIDSGLSSPSGMMVIVGVVASEKVNGKTIRVIRFRERKL
ncbi:MAG: metallophosphoesterase family protein [Armatimonadetes bacterium]|nr:metallophosphoesterase family protein [Armatimonadota bacterium]